MLGYVMEATKRNCINFTLRPGSQLEEHGTFSVRMVHFVHCTIESVASMTRLRAYPTVLYIYIWNVKL